jgi:hypothetical protein
VHHSDKPLANKGVVAFNSSTMSAQPILQNVLYIRTGEENTGPYHITQVKSMWNSGLITADAHCWREGWPEWMLVSKFLGLDDQIEPSVTGIKLTSDAATSALKAGTAPPILDVPSDTAPAQNWGKDVVLSGETTPPNVLPEEDLALPEHWQPEVISSEAPSSKRAGGIGRWLFWILFFMVGAIWLFAEIGSRIIKSQSQVGVRRDNQPTIQKSIQNREKELISDAVTSAVAQMLQAESAPWKQESFLWGLFKTHDLTKAKGVRLKMDFPLHWKRLDSEDSFTIREFIHPQGEQYGKISISCRPLSSDQILETNASFSRGVLPSWMFQNEIPSQGSSDKKISINGRPSLRKNWNFRPGNVKYSASQLRASVWILDKDTLVSVHSSSENKTSRDKYDFLTVVQMCYSSLAFED